MKTSRKRIIGIGILLAVFLALAAAWYFWLRPSGLLVDAWDSLVNRATPPPSGTLRASGSVETTVLNIASELTGKITEVDFQEGDQVKAGQVLIRLDDSTLTIQRKIVAANLDTARLALQQLDSPTILAALQNTIAQDAQAVDDARRALDLQKYYMNDTASIQNARANLLLAEKAMQDAKKAYDKLNGDPATDTNKAAAYQKYYQVEQAYDKALTVYQLWTGGPNQEQADLKEANLALASAKLADDQAYLGALNGGAFQGPIPDNATGTGIARLRQARIALQSAQARLALLDDQIGKMTITAPVDGVVMSRSADPGNVVSPGVELLSLARWNDLTITVYIPKASLGSIKVGQTATVRVDSFPGETFHAEVLSISAQPVFLPRTTQTVSGDSSTVHAVQLVLKDAAGKLKPGMPADVDFILH